MAYTDVDYVGSIMDRRSTDEILQLPQWKPSDLEEQNRECGSESRAEAKLQAMTQGMNKLLRL